MSNKFFNLFRSSRNLIIYKFLHPSIQRYSFGLKIPSPSIILPVTTTTSLQCNSTRLYSTRPKQRPNNRTDTTRTFQDYFENLNSYFLANGYVNSSLFAKTIESSDVTQIDEHQSVFLLECISCMPTQSQYERMKLFNNFWNTLKQNDLLKKSHILAALKFFQKNQIPLKNIRQLIEDVKDFENDLLIYEQLIYLACENGDMDEATTSILAEMKEKNLPLTENIFNALVLGHSRNKDVKSCELVLDTMNASNIIPTNETLTELLRAYVENDELMKAEKLLNDRIENLTTNQVVKVLKIVAQKNHRNLVEKLLKYLPEDVRHSNEIPKAFKNLCIELLYSNQVDAAFLIIDCFPTPNYKDDQDIDTFAVFFVNELVRCEHYDIEKVVEICKKLTEKNTRALHIATEMMLRRDTKKGDKFLKALAEVDNLRPHYFWPLFLYNFKTEGEIGILNTLKLMSSLKVECDHETLSHYIFPRLSIILKNIETAVKTLEDCGLKTSLFLTPMIYHLLLQQKTEEVYKLCQLYTSKLDTSQFIYPLSYTAVNVRATKNYKRYANLIKILITKSENQNLDLAGQILLEIFANPRLNKDMEGLSKILYEMKLYGVQISSISADILVGHLSKFIGDKYAEDGIKSVSEMITKGLNLSPSEMSGSSIPHPSDMTLDELECNLIELETKKMNTRGVLRRLLQLCVRDNRLERALEVKKKCDQLKVHVSPGMMASIFDLYIKVKDLTAAKNAFENLKKHFPGFQIDEHKIVDYCTLLVENNKLQEAHELLSKRAETTYIKGGEYLKKNVWNLLAQTAITEAKTNPENPQNVTKMFFIFLKKYNFCKINNVLLGPIIRECLLKKQLKSAVEEFKDLTETFKQTPLQFELTSILVNASNGGDKMEYYQITEQEAKPLLQDVVTAVAKIHGAISSNSSLLLAIAESGTENQLRKLLINPEFRINQDSVTKNIEHLSSVGRIETIVKLAKACRGLGHVLNEQELYKILLNEFGKQNNYESAIELYNRLEADDELKITQEFVKHLVDLLQINKINIPSNIALRAQVIT